MKVQVKRWGTKVAPGVPGGDPSDIGSVCAVGLHRVVSRVLAAVGTQGT